MINRRFASLATCAIALPSFAQVRWRPSKPIKIIVGFPAGGPADSMARRIRNSWGQLFTWPVVIENLAGDSGQNATKAAAKSEGDGHTLYFGSSEVLLSKLGREELLPLASVAISPLVVVSNSVDSLTQLKNKPNPTVFATGYNAPLVLKQL